MKPRIIAGLSTLVAVIALFVATNKIAPHRSTDFRDAPRAYSSLLQNAPNAQPDQVPTPKASLVKNSNTRSSKGPALTGEEASLMVSVLENAGVQGNCGSGLCVLEVKGIDCRVRNHEEPPTATCTVTPVFTLGGINASDMVSILRNAGVQDNCGSGLCVMAAQNIDCRVRNHEEPPTATCTMSPSFALSGTNASNMVSALENAGIHGSCGSGLCVTGVKSIDCRIRNHEEPPTATCTATPELTLSGKDASNMASALQSAGVQGNCGSGLCVMAAQNIDCRVRNHEEPPTATCSLANMQ